MKKLTLTITADDVKTQATNFFDLVTFSLKKLEDAGIDPKSVWDSLGHICMPDDSFKYSDDHRVWSAGNATFNANKHTMEQLLKESVLGGVINLAEWTNIRHKKLGQAMILGSIDYQDWGINSNWKYGTKSEIGEDLIQTITNKMGTFKVLLEKEEYVVNEWVKVPDQLYKIGAKKGQPRTWKSVKQDVVKFRYKDIDFVEVTINPEYKTEVIGNLN